MIVSGILPPPVLVLVKSVTPLSAPWIGLFRSGFVGPDACSVLKWNAFGRPVESASVIGTGSGTRIETGRLDLHLGILMSRVNPGGAAS